MKCLFGCFTFFQKTNKNKSTSSKFDFVRSCFGKNVGLKKSFRIWLTFRNLANWVLFWGRHILLCPEKPKANALTTFRKCSQTDYLFTVAHFQRNKNLFCLINCKMKQTVDSCWRAVKILPNLTKIVTGKTGLMRHFPVFIWAKPNFAHVLLHSFLRNKTIIFSNLIAYYSKYWFSA